MAVSNFGEKGELEGGAWSSVTRRRNMSLHPNTAIRLPVDKMRRTALQILAILWPNPISNR